MKEKNRKKMKRNGSVRERVDVEKPRKEVGSRGIKR